MKKLFLKLLFFSLPFVLLVLNYTRYEISGGDLNRLGKISIEKEYRKKFHYFEIKVVKLYDTCLKKMDILILGDSFSENSKANYVNALANLSNLQISRIDRDKNEYPIQSFAKYSNSDFFDTIKVKYFILETVERHILENIDNIDNMSFITYNDFLKLNVKNNLPKNNLQENNFNKYVSAQISEIFKFFKFNLFYLIDDNAFNSEVYLFKADKKLFSTHENELLIYDGDIVSLNKDKNKIIQLNNFLNQFAQNLKKQGVTLIFLPAADKYDVYSKFIKNNPYSKNPFFDIFRTLEKQYIFIDSKKVLLEAVQKGTLDVYFADDTHWSPIGSKIVAQEIVNQIEKFEKQQISVQP